MQAAPEEEEAEEPSYGSRSSGKLENRVDLKATEMTMRKKKRGDEPKMFSNRRWKESRSTKRSWKSNIYRKDKRKSRNSSRRVSKMWQREQRRSLRKSNK